jgi:hypothetical protein
MKMAILTRNNTRRKAMNELKLPWKYVYRGPRRQVSKRIAMISPKYAEEVMNAQIDEYYQLMRKVLVKTGLIRVPGIEDALERTGPFAGI